MLAVSVRFLVSATYSVLKLFLEWTLFLGSGSLRGLGVSLTAFLTSIWLLKGGDVLLV